MPTTWTTGTTEVLETGTWRAALPRHIAAPSPCHAACPVNGDIAEWIGLARARDWRAAWDVLTRHNPFPAVAGRVCHHPCEAACNRAAYDAAVSICKLERHVGDIAIAAGFGFAPPAAERAGRVAIVGGGPAGLAAAYQLRRRGWRVTLYEASAELGGLLRHGIPAYRLPRDVLDAEIARIVALGVDVHRGARLADAAAFARLRAEHDAVFVATGAALPKRLPWLDAAAPWFADGASFLAAANAGMPLALGRRLVVVGGGSAAIDAARSARRAGHDVTLVALETEPQLPAQRDEVDEALDEGITLVDGAMLERARRRDDGTLVLDGVRVRFEAGPDRSTFRITPLPASAFVLEADAVVASIGNDVDAAPFGDTLPLRGALLDADARTLATPVPGVFAGGDVASHARFVTEAIGMGRRAALAIDAQLRARGAAVAADLCADPGVAREAHAAPTVPLDAIATWHHGPAARRHAPTLAPAARLASQAEVQRGLDADAALAEAERCFSCGRCIECDNCAVLCPDLAIVRAPGGGDAAIHYEVLADWCKGCGLCVRECPTGAMTMVEEAR